MQFRPEHLNGVHIASSFIFGAVFLWIVVCPFVFFFWPLCCLSLNLRIIITPLVSPNLYLAKKKYQQTKKLNKNDERTLETKRSDTHHLTMLCLFQVFS